MNVDDTRRALRRTRQGALDLFDDVPLSLADDPDIELGALLTVPIVERQHVEDVEDVEDVEHAPAPVDPMRSREYRRSVRDYIRNGPDQAPAPDPESVRAMFEGFGWQVTR